MANYHLIHDDGERRAIVEYNEDGDSVVAYYAVRVTWKNDEPAPTKDEIDEYVAYSFPATRCHHEYDCCGHWYDGTAYWSEFSEPWESPDEKTIIVRQHSHQNI